MTTTQISDLREGQLVDGEYGLAQRSRAVDKNGRAYADLKLQDASGVLMAKRWKISDAEWEAIAPPEITCVRVRGSVEAFNGTLQINAAQVAPGADPYRTEGFVLTTPGDRNGHWQALKELVNGVKDANLRELLRVLFTDSDFRRRYAGAPAADALHHAYDGGLLEHSLEVANLCLAAAQHYPALRPDLLIVGALLHDVGKVEERERSGLAYVHTMDGGLLGHVMLGAARVERAMNMVPGFPPELRAEVLHLILSHHGNKEWGAPVLPAMDEAFLLHYCDQISAKLALCRNAQAQAADSVFVKTRGWDAPIYTRKTPLIPAPEHEMVDILGPEPADEPDETADARPFLRIVPGLLSEDGKLPEMIALPILGRIAAGTPIAAQQHVEGYMVVPVTGRGDAEDFLLRVRGDSMRDAHILDGDLVRVRPLRGEPREGAIVAALLNGDVTVKRFHRDDGCVVLLAENPDYPHIPVESTDSLSIQGTVVGLIRDAVG